MDDISNTYKIKSRKTVRRGPKRRWKGRTVCVRFVRVGHECEEWICVT